MKTLSFFFAVAALFAASPSHLRAQTVQRVASFDEKGKEYPESIAADRAGNLYLSLTFAKKVKKVTPDGRQSDFAQIPDQWLLGVAFDPAGNLVVAGASGIWKVSPTGIVWMFAAVPGHKSLNDFAYDASGNLYASDDELFAIWKIDPQGNAVIWSSDPHYRVTDATYPIPVGCNGLAFSHDLKTLFIDNTSEGLLLAVDLRADGSASPARVIVQDPQLIGADGIKCDAADNIYVAQNIQRKILRISKSGTITSLAEGGLLSFPTSLVFGRGMDANTLFISNNGDAFFSNKPSGQGVLRLDLAR